MHTGEVDEYVWLYMNIYLWVCECIHLYIYIYIYLRKDDRPAIAKFHLVSRVVPSSNHLESGNALLWVLQLLPLPSKIAMYAELPFSEIISFLILGDLHNGQSCHICFQKHVWCTSTVFSRHVRLEDTVVRLTGAKGARAKVTKHH